MPRKNIYLWNDAKYDYSRWISLAQRVPQTCVLHLADVCQPGKVSRFDSVSIPSAYLKDTVERGGSLQITLSTGFLLVQCHDDLVLLEFRGAGDIASVRATCKAEDVLNRILDGEETSRMALIR